MKTALACAGFARLGVAMKWPWPVWWAYGGYDKVTRQTSWSLPRFRREVCKAMCALGLRPVGHRGYAQLRQRIMASQFLDNDLI